MPSLKINDSFIDWMSRDSHLFFDVRRRRRPGVGNSLKPPFFPGHIYLFTSSHRKMAVLPKEAFLASARAVSRYLQCAASDRWLIALPLTHVAGIAVLARSFCCGFSIVKPPGGWDPRAFWTILKTEKITLSALVPAQVYDVVRLGLSAPAGLRAVLVGGGSLPPSLYGRARGLGWPLLPSYGLTELCSTAAVAKLSSVESPIPPALAGADLSPSAEGTDFAKGASAPLTVSAPFRAVRRVRGATGEGFGFRREEKPLKSGKGKPPPGASAGERQSGYKACLKSEDRKPPPGAPAGRGEIPFPDLEVLPHVQMKMKGGTFHIKSKALLKGYFDPEENRFWDPKSGEGWFDTGDLGELSGKKLTIQGRKERQIKILGELTDLTALSRDLQSLVSDLRLRGRFLLIPVPDPRKTWDLQLITTSFDEGDILKAVREFNKQTAPFQRIKRVYAVPNLPEGDFSGLFKLSPADIRKHIGLSEPPL